MSDPGKLPEVPASALRDAATDERTERVWKRIDGNLVGAAPRALRAATAWTWAPAAVVIVFASGVFVGAHWVRSEPSQATRVSPEPLQPPPGLTPPEVVPSRAEEPSQPKKNQHRRRLHRAPGPLPELKLAPEEVDQSLPAPGPATQVLPEWQRLCDEGQYEQAGAAINRQGGFDAVLSQASPEQLMLLFDIARVSRDHTRALAALRKVVNNHPNNPNAPYAAYQLGLWLKKGGDLAGAARAFAAYRALSPDGDFSEDALARQVEAAIEQGELELARQLADQYAREFPTGDGLDEFREVLESGGASVASSSAPDESAPPATSSDDTEEETGSAAPAGATP